MNHVGYVLVLLSLASLLQTAHHLALAGLLKGRLLPGTYVSIDSIRVLRSAAYQHVAITEGSQLLISSKRIVIDVSDRLIRIY